jgi:peptide/nickel transport system substrate-binding protein
METRMSKRSYALLIGLTLVVLAVACGTAATPTPTPTQEAVSTLAPVATSPPVEEGARPSPMATPVSQPTVTPAPSGVVSALDSITLVVGQEPLTMNSFVTVGGISTSIVKDNMVDPLTWQSGDNLRIVPTTATTGWEQVAPDTWRFTLRQGVKFHNGEAWNAQAALPSLEFQGTEDNANSSVAYTGPFQAKAVDEYTLDIICAQPCPIFPQTSIFLNFQAPDFYTSASEEELSRRGVGFGPYKLVEWQHGISVTQEAYEDYVPVGDHFEFQKPMIQNVTWHWRDDKTVMRAMVESGEADIAWDVGVDAIEALGEDQVRSGGSAEVYGFWINTLWHPELKKKEVRQAMVHSINCQLIVDTFFGGFPPCRGNIIFPGVLGATERNTAPYEFNPELSRQLLKEANYNPQNAIKITSRAARIPNQVEVSEALQGFMEDVGINAEVNIVDPAIRQEMRECGIGAAVNKVGEEKGEDPDTYEPTLADMQAALEKGPACPTGDLIGAGGFSSETLDFGRQAVNYLNCTRVFSFYCDPSPGGVQTKIAPALAASGEERERLMIALADLAHDEVIFLPLFDLPVFYAVDPKLNWKPRFDRRVRISTMWFRE